MNSVYYPSQLHHLLQQFPVDVQTVFQFELSNPASSWNFDLKAGKWAAFEMLNRLQIVDISNNLGDAKSLATHPATTTHMRIGAEERAKLGITDGTIRLSVGLEDAEDVIADLVQALGA